MSVGWLMTFSSSVSVLAEKLRRVGAGERPCFLADRGVASTSDHAGGEDVVLFATAM
jgi:hypothetical protein